MSVAASPLGNEGECRERENGGGVGDGDSDDVENLKEGGARRAAESALSLRRVKTTICPQQECLWSDSSKDGKNSTILSEMNYIDKISENSFFGPFFREVT